MAKYRKKPVIVEARKFETNNEADSLNINTLVLWMNQGSPIMRAWHNGTDIYIETMEGQLKASVGDWIIRGVNGEFYSCKPDIFEKTYEPVDSQEAP